jgi:TatD DNase family protein
MKPLPALDLHAHVEPGIAPDELVALNAAVFAVTRSLDEAESVLHRTDATTVWGVGCHPGLIDAQQQFSATRFSGLLDSSPFVGEVGLDGESRVPMATQTETLRLVLQTLATKPRIASIHSFAATAAILELLVELRPAGIVLHWWLGSRAETARAVELGCYFSVNAAMLRRSQVVRDIPLDRLLIETDHPFGDRRSPPIRRPGAVSDVQGALGNVHRLAPEAVSIQLWRNLRAIASAAQVGGMLPKELRRHMAAV